MANTDVEESERKAGAAAQGVVNRRSAQHGSDGSEHPVDERDDHAFVEEDAEHVCASCAHGAQNSDFAFLVGDGHGNEVEQHQRGKHGEADAYVKEYLRQRFDHVVHKLQHVADLVVQLIADSAEVGVVKLDDFSHRGGVVIRHSADAERVDGVTLGNRAVNLVADNERHIATADNRA